MMHTDLFRLEDILVIPEFNPREVDPAYCAELVAHLQADPKNDFDRPLVLFRDQDTGDHVLAKGFHRHNAYVAAGLTEVVCEVHDGDTDAAAMYALSADDEPRGKRRTADDKRSAVQKTISRRPDWTDRQVAEHVGVSHPFAANIRASLAAVNATPDDSDLVTVTKSDRDEHGKQNDDNVRGTDNRSGADNAPESDSRGKGRQGGSAKRSKKEKHATAASKLLQKDHSLPDVAIAAQVGDGCKVGTVATARKALVKAGRIPAPPKKPKAKTAPGTDSHDENGTALVGGSKPNDECDGDQPAQKTTPKAATGDSPKPPDEGADAKEVFAKPAKSRENDDPSPDPRFMANAAQAADYASKFRNWMSRLRAVHGEMRKAFPDIRSVMAERIDFANYEAQLAGLVETLDKNIPEHVCPPCAGVGKEPKSETACKFCNGYGIVDKGFHGGLKAKWKSTRHLWDERLASAEGGAF